MKSSRKVIYSCSMANNRLKAQWQKVYMGKQALGIWACLSLPSILVTLVLYFCPEESGWQLN